MSRDAHDFSPPGKLGSSYFCPPDRGFSHSLFRMSFRPAGALFGCPGLPLPAPQNGAYWAAMGVGLALQSLY